MRVLEHPFWVQNTKELKWSDIVSIGTKYKIVDICNRRWKYDL